MSKSSPVAVITGVAGGIGSASAAVFLARGWTVHGLDRRGSEIPGITSHECDVTDPNALVALATGIGPIDALIPAAGINLMLAVRAFRPKIRPDGAIVLVSSVAAIRAMPHADAYTASKGAISALTRTWAVDYSRDGIRVNCVAPGPTDTDMMKGMREGYHQERQVQLPQQRMATADEVAQVILFLASPEASYVSGVIVPVDGGATAHSAGIPFPKRRIATA